MNLFYQKSATLPLFIIFIIFGIDINVSDLLWTFFSERYKLLTVWVQFSCREIYFNCNRRHRQNKMFKFIPIKSFASVGVLWEFRFFGILVFNQISKYTLPASCRNTPLYALPVTGYRLILKVYIYFRFTERKISIRTFN